MTIDCSKINPVDPSIIAGKNLGLGKVIIAGDDPWQHRSKSMRCSTCMFFVPKEATVKPNLGRCRRHAPTMGGYPVVYTSDWCGDHKVDENKSC